jgi:hypothetical protein
LRRVMPSPRQLDTTYHTTNLSRAGGMDRENRAVGAVEGGM